jgi:hypothetical protein
MASADLFSFHPMYGRLCIIFAIMLLQFDHSLDESHIDMIGYL